MKELVVYPTPQLVRQHRAKYIEGNAGFAGDMPINYEVFVDRCIGEFINPNNFLGDFKKNYIIEGIFRRLSGQLSYFISISHGYVEKISEVIGELKRQDLDADRFKEYAITPRLRDLY